MEARAETSALKSALTTVALTITVIAVAAAILFAEALDGPLGFVFFLLVVVSPVFIGTGAAITVWRLIGSTRIGSTPERLLFATATFIAVCGTGPLLISLALMLLRRQDAPIGAAGIWALVAMFTASLLSFAGVATTLMRYFRKRSRVPAS